MQCGMIGKGRGDLFASLSAGQSTFGPLSKMCGG